MWKAGRNHPCWKNGIYKSGQGYIYIWQPEHPFAKNGRYVAKHKLVIEKIIGRYLFPKEECHHRNGIKDDNRPSNLMAFVNKSAHQRFHKDPINVKPEEIIFDGRELIV